MLRRDSLTPTTGTRALMQVFGKATLLLAASLSAAPTRPAQAQAIDRATLASVVDSIAAEALHEGPVAGLSVAVMRQGELLLAEGYGLADVENEVPASAETVYGIRSVTKHLTAALVLGLVEERALALDDSIGRHLPDLPAHWQPLTVRQLLSHTADVPNYGGETWRRNYRLGLSPAEWLALYRDAPLDFAPGTGYAYSNTGYLLLHLIIEAVTGEPYAEAVRRRLAEPLGLASLVMADARPLVRRRTREYELEGAELVNAVSWGGRGSAAGGLGATVGDLVRFAQALDEGRLLNLASIRLLREPTRLDGGPAIGYALGTRLGWPGGPRLVGHTGDGGGGTAVLAHYPDDGLSIAVLTNTECYSHHAVILQSRIAHHVLGLRVRDAPLSPAEADRYTGEWTADGVRIRVFEQSGALMGQPEGAPAPDHLLPQGEGMFVLEEQLAQGVRFLVEQGRADWGELYWAGFFTDVMRRVPPTADDEHQDPASDDGSPAPE